MVYLILDFNGYILSMWISEFYSIEEVEKKYLKDNQIIISITKEDYEKLVINTPKNYQLRYIDNNFTYEETIITEVENLKHLRNKRDYECFRIVNRGTLWYEQLTKEEFEELNIWYKKWLDITKTKIIPKTPIWLEEK